MSPVVARSVSAVSRRLWPLSDEDRTSASSNGFRECRYSELAVIRIGTVLGTCADQILKAREIAIGSDLLAMRRYLAVDSIFVWPKSTRTASISPVPFKMWRAFVRRKDSWPYFFGLSPASAIQVFSKRLSCRTVIGREDPARRLRKIQSVRFLPDTAIHLASAVADTLDKAHWTDDLLPGRATSITERIVPSGRCTSLMVRLSSSSPRSMVSMATKKRARSLSPLTRRRASTCRICFT